MIRTFDDLARSDFRPLTFDEQVILVSGTLLPENQWQDMVREFKSSRPYKILEKRLEHFSAMNATDRVKVFVSMLCDTPGELVIWAFNLHLLWLESEDDITMDYLTRKYPRGVPDSKAMQSIWDSQKGFNNDMEADNLLDLLVVWKRPELYITQTEKEEHNYGDAN